jgi:hypothetical protein
VDGEGKSNNKDKGEADRTGWRPMLEKSIKKNRSEVTSKYIQLATVRDDGTVPKPEPSTLNPQPSTLNPQPSTLNPKP